jgi:glycerol-3-phosphate acyltransferase PlsY
MIVIFIAMAIGLSESTLWGVAVLAVIGHCFSPYLGFEGGKGVATGMGVMMVMLPLETVIALIVWAIGAKVIRVSSLSSMTALLALVVASFILKPEMAHAPVILIAFILFYKHIPNFVRLIKGEEKRVI